MLNQAAQFLKSINSITKDNHSKDAAPIHLKASFTRKKKDIIAAQKLRYRIFTEEYGAKIRSVRGIDKDRYDKHCLHLIVRDTYSGEIVGYTRVLSAVSSRLTGGFYSSREFDMSAINPIAYSAPTSTEKTSRTVEIGRTCIDARYRNGGTIGVLWSSLGQYIRDNHIRYVIGCASISMADGGIATQTIMERIREKHFTPENLRVKPYKNINIPNPRPGYSVKTPPLLKAYLNMGAKVAGEPYWDIEFNVADLFIFLDMETVSQRYKKHFLRIGN